jgi:putative transposase
VKYAWIKEHRTTYPLTLMCALLAVSVNGFRAWLRGGDPDRKRLTDAQLLALMRAIHAEVKGAYGSPRMLEELRSRGFAVGKTRVERLMREHDIRARHKRRWKATTDSKHDLAVAPNVVARNFAPEAPNRLWSADLTYLWTDEGWLYLAVVIDLFNREVVGWALKERMSADIVTEALSMAWLRRRPQPGLIHHSDRGSQYASGVFQALLRHYGMSCSMSRKGNCWDNAPTESFFNSLKNERVHGRRYRTREEARVDLFEYIEVFFNRRRRHSTLGLKSPRQFMQDWIATRDQAQQAA